MRTIKFRVWDTNFAIFRTETYYAIALDGTVRVGAHVAESKRYVIQQFTGLHDKTGREIYEGDILQVENAKGEVYWNHNGGFDVRGATNKKQWSYRLYHYITYCEVIGNIYENPDLVKEN